MKRTPHPWVLETPMGDDEPWIVEAGKPAHEWQCIAIVPCGEEGPPEGKGNGLLLVNAAELLDACNGLLGLIQLISGRPDLPVGLDDLLLLNHRTAAARAVIAKIEGIA